MEWLSTVLGLLNPMKWFEKAWLYLIRPKLHLYFDPKESYHKRSVTDLGGVHGFFCHVMVRNNGRQIAKKCRGRLIELSFLDPDGRFIPHPDFVMPVVLKWAHEMDFNPRDVETDFPRRLDLCYAVQSKPEVLSFFTQKLPTGNRTDFPIGTYKVNVRVDGENAAAVDGTFIIRYPGVWDEIQVSEAPTQ